MINRLWPTNIINMDFSLEIRDDMYPYYKWENFWIWKKKITNCPIYASQQKGGQDP